MVSLASCGAPGAWARGPADALGIGHAMAPTPMARLGHATGTATAASIALGCAAAPQAMLGAGQATTDFAADVAIGGGWPQCRLAPIMQLELNN